MLIELLLKGITCLKPNAVFALTSVKVKPWQSISIHCSLKAIFLYKC